MAWDKVEIGVWGKAVGMREGEGVGGERGGVGERGNDILGGGFRRRSPVLTSFISAAYLMVIITIDYYDAPSL